MSKGASQVRRSFAADVLVVGGGLAGCTAAIKVRQAGASVILVDQGWVGRSGQTPYAGSYCVFNPEWGDDLDAWVEQVSSIGEHVNNRAWTELCFRESYERYLELQSWGVKFGVDGSAGAGAEPNRGGTPAGPCKAVFMEAREPSMVLRKQVLKHGASIVDRTMIVELLTGGGRVAGAAGIPADAEGAVDVFRAKAVILAAGAGGFRPTRWPINNLTADADCMAYRVGAEITGKEFADPHHARLDQSASVLFGRFGRGPEGGRPPRGRFLDSDGSPLPPARSLSLNLDLAAHAGHAPLYMEMADGSRQPMVGGAASGMSVHKTEGIWPAGMDCSCTIPGLYAAGDSLGTMQSGATYGAIGQSVLGCSVTGSRAGAAAAAHAAASAGGPAAVDLDRVAEGITAPLRRSGGFGPRWVTQMLQNAVVPYYVLYIKHGDRLRAALTNVEFFRDHLVPKLYATDQHELRLAHETRNMVLNAEMRLRASLFRTETRGCHHREDYPLRDDEEWLAWVVLRKAVGAGEAETGAAAADSQGMELLKRPVPDAHRTAAKGGVGR